MDQIIFEVVKWTGSASVGALSSWLRNRGLSKKVVALQEQNSQQQTNVDNLQTTTLNLQAILITTQDKLINTEAELRELQGKVHVMELKSNEDDATKRFLQDRVTELETLCARQETEIQGLRKQLAQVSNTIRKGGTDELKPF